MNPTKPSVKIIPTPTAKRPTIQTPIKKPDEVRVGKSMSNPDKRLVPLPINAPQLDKTEVPL
jgi:hypothetical protein